MKSNINCRICNSSNTKKICELKTDWLGEKDILKLVKCNKCGVVFIGSEISKASLDKYIGTVEDLENTDGISYNSRIKTIKNYRKLNKILDFGCGFGGFLKEAKKNGWDVYGQEVSEKAIEHVKNNLNIKNCFSSDKNLKILCDVVLIWAVIEHLDFPLETIKRLSANIRKGGAFIMLYPNPNNLFF